MAPPSSEEEEEQGKEEADTVAPAAPERQEEDVEEALSSLGSCHARCSEVLEAARRRRVTGELELHCLDFLEKELSIIVAGLKALSPQHVDEEMMQWLRWLTDFMASDTLRPALDQADRQRHNTLLRRAARCIHRRHRPWWWWICYGLAEYRLWRYRYLLPATSRHGLPPEAAAEEGDGMDWFGRSPAPFDDSPYGNDPLIMLCMSIFPYGYKFNKDQLVMRWLFEGLFFSFQVFHTYAEAEAADDYFSCLVDRNVITHAAPDSRRRTNLPDEAEAWQWNVDQNQHQLLATKSAEIGFVFTSATLNLLAEASATGHVNEASRIPRRLALHDDVPNIPSLLQSIDLSQTRSLAVSGAVSIGVPLDKFANLVVLDVEGWENFGDEDLLQICRSKMFFLVYLSVRGTRVSKLPPEIKELLSLQVLDASYTQVTEIPLGVFVGTRLHRLYLRGTRVSKLPLEIKDLCSLQVLDASYTQVTEIPLGVFVGTELYRLDLRGTAIRQVVPEQLRGLQYSLTALLLGDEGMINSAETAIRVPHDILRFSLLHTLATIDLSEQPASFIKALGDLKYLKVLAITWYFHQSSDGDYCDALLSSIGRWRRLESLTIHCGLGCSMEFLGSLSRPPMKLEKFKVTLGRFTCVPQWFPALEHLSSVQITVCKQGAQNLEILRDLPELKCLILGLDFIPKEAIVIGNEGFRQLQRFSIDCPVPWLTFESEAMSKLTYLQLEFRACPTDPISVPSGISNLCSLTEVALWYNVRYANSPSVKMTVEAVREEVAMRRNSIQMVSLFINGIEQDDAQAIDEETKNTTGPPSGPSAGAQEDEAVDEKTTAVVDTEITEAES